MKKKAKRTNDASETPKPRTVKIADTLHHEIRVLSVELRIPMQSCIEQLLRFGLQKKAYEKFATAAA